jgi:hypothetical protein
MKNIFYLIMVFLLLSTLAQAQCKWITAGDSCYTKDNSKKGTFTLLAVQDTLGGCTDTLLCEVYDEDMEWLPIGVSKMTDSYWEMRIIPGDGVKALYIINYPTPTILRVRRINVINRSSKTKVKFIYIANI